MTIYLANDTYSASLRSTWIYDPADADIDTDAIPTNTPTILTVGWGTDYETVFYVTSTSGDSPSNYALTGVTRLKGYEGNLAEGLAINCLNHEEYFNQWGTSITALEEMLDGTDADGISPADVHLPTGGQIDVNEVDPWRTISIFGGLQPCTTSPCGDKEIIEAGTNDIDYHVLDFDASSDERAFINFQMPDSWDGGVIQFRYSWTNAGGGSAETVTFELSGRSFADSDAIDQAVGTAIEVEDTWLAQGDEHLSAWSGDVTLAGGPAAGEWVHFEVMRDISEDDLTGDARLKDVQIRYKQDQYSD